MDWFVDLIDDCSGLYGVFTYQTHIRHVLFVPSSWRASESDRILYQGDRVSFHVDTKQTQ